MKRYLAGLATGLLLLVTVGKAAELTPAQTRVFKHRLHKSETVVNWWNHRGRWALFPRYDACWQVRLSARHRRICRLARASLAAHAARRDRLKRLLASPAPALVFSSVGLPWPWSCIHQHEGSWDANTGNGYYGGFQMDISFQLEFGAWAYARWGTANNWSPSVQYEVARQAPLSRWPTYARYCA